MEFMAVITVAFGSECWHSLRKTHWALAFKTRTTTCDKFKMSFAFATRLNRKMATRSSQTDYGISNEWGNKLFLSVLFFSDIERFHVNIIIVSPLFNVLLIEWRKWKRERNKKTFVNIRCAMELSELTLLIVNTRQTLYDSYRGVHWI